MTRTSNFSQIIKALENPLAAGLVIFVSLVLFGLIVRDWYLSVFSMIIAYMLSDIAIDLVIKGGNGIAIIAPKISNQTKHKGHAFIAFFCGIIAATIVSETISDHIANVIKNDSYWAVIILICSGVMAGIVYLDLQTRFYAHK